MKETEYKNITNNIIGIYWFRNIDTNEYYVGQSLDIRERFCTHLRHIRNKWNYPFYNAVNKYGFEKFEFQIESIIEREGRDNKTLSQILNDLEIKTIEKYNSYNNGYNLTIGGASVSGYKISEELKKKYSVISTKIQHDGRNTIYVYNIKTKEYSEWPTLKTFLIKYNLTSRHLTDKKLVVVDNQWIAARSKEQLEEKIKAYPNHNMIGVQGIFKHDLGDETLINDLNNLSIKEFLQKYNITKGTYYNYLKRLNIPNRSSIGKDPRVKCSKENFIKEYYILTREQLCEKYNIGIRRYYELRKKYIIQHTDN